MTDRRVAFVKGHMGGDEVVLLYADQIPESERIAVASSVLAKPSIRGHNSGLVYHSDIADLKVDAFDATCFEPVDMCGGVTQVLGKAIIETDLASHFELAIREQETTVILETAVGLAPIRILHQDGKVERVLTDMTAFAEECYAAGVERLEVADINAFRVGPFLVMNGDAARQVHPDVTFEEMGEKEFQVFQKAQREFHRHIERETSSFSLYDLHSESHSGRLVFPHGLEQRYYEPSCGSGTVATGIAMVENGEIDANGDFSLVFEMGGDIFSLGGPDTMELRLVVQDKKVTQACISHSLVEILATGYLWV
jgi:hypothetical protein